MMLSIFVKPFKSLFLSSSFFLRTFRNLEDILADSPCNPEEGLFYRIATLSRGFKELHAVLFCDLLSLFIENLSLCTLIFKVRFVSKKYAGDVVISVLPNHCHPVMHCIEGLSVCYVIDYDESICSFVEFRHNWRKMFLT